MRALELPTEDTARAAGEVAAVVRDLARKYL